MAHGDGVCVREGACAREGASAGSPTHSRQDRALHGAVGGCLCAWVRWGLGRERASGQVEQQHVKRG